MLLDTKTALRLFQLIYPILPMMAATAHPGNSFLLCARPARPVHGRDGLRPLPPAHLRRPTGAPPETPRSTSNPGLEVLRGVSGGAHARVSCRIGGTGGHRHNGLGCQAGFGWVAQTRETANGPESGQRLARDPSGKPSNPSIGKSDKPGFASKGLGMND